MKWVHGCVWKCALIKIHWFNKMQHHLLRLASCMLYQAAKTCSSSFFSLFASFSLLVAAWWRQMCRAKNQIKLFGLTFVHLYLYIKVHQIVANPSTNLHNKSWIGPRTIFIYIKSAMSLCHSQIQYIDIQYASQAYTKRHQMSIVNFSMIFCHYSSSFDINWAVSGTDDVLWCYQT